MTDTAEKRLDAHPDCSTCHLSDVTEVVNAISDGKAGDTVSCETCHTNTAIGVSFHGLDAAGAAGIHNNLAMPPVNSCGDCHETGSAEARINLHPECTTCHTSTKSDVTGAINGGKGATGTPASCDDCHTGTANGAIVHGLTSATAAASHDYFADSNTCTVCHMTDTAEKRLDAHLDCNTCHTSTVGAVVATITTGRGDAFVSCENCHDDPGVLMHSLDPETLHNNFMGSINCGQCHDIDTIVKRVEVHGDCTTCHASTDTVVMNAINSAKGESTTTVNCETCHGDYGHPDAIHSRITNLGSICYDCHGQDLTPPPPGQAVSIIHRDKCLICHTSTRANVVASIVDGKLGNMQYCTDCHTPAADPKVDPQEHHVPAHDNVFTPEVVCKDCHVENVAIEHDSPNTVSCSTCHAEPFFLVPIINSARSSNPDAQPISCANCHTATNMTSHRAAHDKTVLPSAECAECHDANVAIEHVDNRTLECTTCHNSTNTLVQNAIANGKGHLGVEINCYDCHTGSLDHKAAHDSARLDDEVYCANCHAGNVVTEHVDNRGFTCGTCHNDPLFTLEGGIIDQGIAGTTIYCTTCHTTSNHTNAHNKTTTSTTDTTCVDCHDNDVAVEHVTDRGLECTVCHLSTDQNVIDVINSGKGPGGTTVECSACHTDAGNHKPQHDKVGLPGTGVECVECHADNVVTEHVEDRAFTCLTCHDSTVTAVQQTISNGMAGIQQDCYDCHIDTGGHEAAHDMTDVPSPDCAACHSINVATEHVTNHGLACTVCHSSTDPNVIAAIDKGKGPAGMTVLCTDCHMAVNHSASHVDTNVPEPICENCHDPNVFVEHVTVRNRDCSICHNPTYQDVIDQGVANTITVTCTTCHITPDHHNNDSARTGMCTSCHGDPRPLDNDPQQLACRQCHIDNNGFVKTSSPTAPSHAFNTMANIQDFGACFDCHAPIPYHAKPIQTPECWKIMPNSPDYDPTLAPGKDSFNLFAREFQYPDDRWDGSQWDSQANRYCAPISRSNWWNPDINFNWFPIVYNGEMMDVPVFDQADNFPAYPHSRIMTDDGSNCGECHTVGTVIEVTHNNDCIGCHFSKASDVEDAISWGRAGNDVYCSNCHGTGGHTAQHDMTQLNQPSCSECHVDNVVTEHVGRIHTGDGHEITCSDCHNNPAYTDVINNGKNGFTVTCFDCHGTADHASLHATDVDEPGCADCHAPNVVTEHLVNQGLDCINCHESNDPNVVDTIAGLNGAVTCRDCHGQDAGNHAAAHDNTGPNGGTNCTDCHSGNVVTEHITNQSLTCGTCHDNPLYTTLITSGKSGNSADYVSCEDCHGPDASDHVAAHDYASTPSTGCNTCHDPNVVTEHLDNPALSCGTCHDNPAYTDVINTGKGGALVTCYDCHGQNGHHAGAEAQAGDCTYCHADPRLGTDPNAPVGQLACVECHGPNQHNNGGPIQDFGACFACHQPTPYHAKPASYQDCWKTIPWVTSYYVPTLAPGKGTFNLFRSEFQRPSKYYDHTQFENYGKHECDDNRSSFNSPAVSFSWVTFTDVFGTNQEWTVPTFGTGGGGPPGGNDTVTITYARYDSRRDRLTVYAENSMGNNAQLTVHYDGDSYNMDWDSRDDRWEDRISDSSCRDSTIEVTSSAGGSDTMNVDRCY